MNKFKDKIAIVTGGGSGIGRSLCEDLCNAGATVVVADINSKGADVTVQAVNACGGDACSSCIDVTSEKDIQKLIDDQKIYIEGEWVWVKNLRKYNDSKSASASTSGMALVRASV